MIKLDEFFRIETDSNNFTLIREKKKFDEKKQKEYISKDEWYYPRIDLCLTKYVNESIKVAENIQELRDIYVKITSIIENVKS
jgi:hypothetical protein